MTENAAFVALSRLTKQQATHEHYAAFEKETLGEQSHRGAAILLITNVENSLESTIMEYFVYKRTNKLFGMDCPLQSFRNKIWMAYALNMFGDQMYCNLECMRHIRNAFAHAKIPITFQTKEVDDVCNLMKMPILRHPYTVGAEKVSVSHLVGLPRFRKLCERIGHNIYVRGFHRAIKIKPDALNMPIGSLYTEIVARIAPLP